MTDEAWYTGESILDFEDGGESLEMLYVPHVCIIESPSAGERSMGRREGLALSEALRIAGIRHKLFDVDNVPALEAAFDEMADFCSPKYAIADTGTDKRKVAFPRIFVHLSCHGNEDGIGLTSGEFVPWPRLGQLLLKFAADLGAWRPGVPVAPMYVCMSSCCGLHAQKMVTADACPFMCLVGCKEEIDWRDSLTAFNTFYHQVINKKRNVRRAVAAINEASLQREVFEWVTAQDLGVGEFGNSPTVVLMCADPDGRFQWIFDRRTGRSAIPVIWPKDEIRDLVTGEPMLDPATGGQFPYFDDPMEAVAFMRANPERSCQVERGAAQEIHIRIA